MYSATSISKRLDLVPILVVMATQLFLMRNVSSLNMTNAYLHHKCLANGKLKPGSQNKKFRNFIIHRFLQNKDYFQIGYGLMLMGNEPDMVSVTFQCRGDSYGPNCRSCFATAQSELSKRCPRDKGGLILYDQCVVEFSPVETKGKIDYDNNLCISNAKNTSGDLVSEWLTLLDKLKDIIVVKSTIGHYAAGEKMFQEKKMYTMVQCIKDLSIKDCEMCLSYTFLHFQDCYENKEGARSFLGRSCNFRFEFYPFINPKTSPNYYKF